MSFFNIVAATNEDTVVAAYEPSKVRSDSYQSEAELEKEFIRLLCEQGYTYLPLHTEDELIANLRSQLEELNHYHFSDTEWRQFFSDVIANPNEHIPEKTRKIQEDNVQVLHRDDGSSKNITLIDKKNIHNNRLQVINQYEVKQADGARHDNRYDVTILVNGFPLVHVELKRRGVAIREAFNQINRYQRDSFWAGCGLYEYVQIFVISNGTNTKYYSNSTRYNAIKDAKHGKTKKEKSSNSFEFTSYWADANNRVLTDLIDFKMCIRDRKKGKTDNKVLFIDASSECVKVTNNNKLTPENINKIVDTFAQRAEEAHFSHLAEYSEVQENDYNLSVSTYVEAKDTREKIDIVKLNAEIAQIVARENELRAAIDQIVAEIEG